VVDRDPVSAIIQIDGKNKNANNNNIKNKNIIIYGKYTVEEFNPHSG
jgi:hypothetical protein